MIYVYIFDAQNWIESKRPLISNYSPRQILSSDIVHLIANISIIYNMCNLLINFTTTLQYRFYIT
jgi:hypothetical protein